MKTGFLSTKLSNRKRLYYCLVGAIMLALVILKVFVESRSEYRKGEQNYKEQKKLMALIHFERAIHWYLPFNPYVNKSIQRLWRIAEDYNNANRPKDALRAYRSLRGSIYSIRSFYTPYKKIIRNCDEKIMLLVPVVEKHRNVQENFVGSGEGSREVLGKNHSPHPGWILTMQIGFWGWILMAISYIFVRTAEHPDQLKKTLFPLSGRGFFVIFLFFYALWILGMLRA